MSANVAGNCSSQSQRERPTVGIAQRLGVTLAGRPRRGREPCDGKPGMLLKSDQELLSDHSRCPDYRYLNGHDDLLRNTNEGATRQR